ncbi:curli production assembly/transport component CsgG [Tibeticola sediminis]|uniref:Curli production assembly/transport component CsgG n=1 Tax=Tibeticola sediminis TaxID=1917811 RepID=A0A3N4VJS9_9BURK|nr:CsgG/HfaB family protein [Tibeticola sediminis]RPE73224.1 curli production assembly/transport component CsgG [Tibeticola sediminis]
MHQLKCCLAGVLLVVLAACSKQEEAPAPSAASAPAPAASTQKGSPDFGGVTKVTREVEGIGSTQELAVVSALQSAVAQVNGVRVAGQMQSLRAELGISSSSGGADSIRGEAFVQKVLAASQGAVTGFEILSQEEVTKLDEETIGRVRASDEGYSYSASASVSNSANVRSNSSATAKSGTDSANASGSFSGSANYSEKAQVDVKRGASSYESDVHYKKMRSYWKVRLKVDVAQYRAPDEQGRPKIVVAMPKMLTATYAVGDRKVPAEEVARTVRARLSDILTQTKRFIVLDREFGADLQAEVDHISSGNVRIQDSARIGQQLATDLILIPTVEQFEYPRTVQKLRMSDRELISYSGGGRITLRLLNASTGQVVMSNSFEHKLASADPSTMPRVIDGKSMSEEMMNSLATQIGAAIVTEIFPVSVVSMSGDQVVLSQGGDVLKVGQRWQAVLLGEELKDPQTGRSLGRNEQPVGTVRIDRVSSQTSYGTMEDGALKQPVQAGSILLKQLLAARASSESPNGDTVSTASAAERRPRPEAQAAKDSKRTEKPKDQEPAPKPADDKNW